MVALDRAIRQIVKVQTAEVEKRVANEPSLSRFT
jgi:hypothetical protein